MAVPDLFFEFSLPSFLSKCSRCANNVRARKSKAISFCRYRQATCGTVTQVKVLSVKRLITQEISKAARPNMRLSCGERGRLSHRCIRQPACKCTDVSCAGKGKLPGFAAGVAAVIRLGGLPDSMYREKARVRLPSAVPFRRVKDTRHASLFWPDAQGFQDPSPFSRSHPRACL